MDPTEYKVAARQSSASDGHDKAGPRERDCDQTDTFFKVSLFHAATSLMLVRSARVTSLLQIIFRSEPSSDLLDHFATIGIVY